MTLKEFIEFTFQSFWHFIGVIMILGLILNGIVEFARAIFKR
jgi:hypothetical protein